MKAVRSAVMTVSDLLCVLSVFRLTPMSELSEARQVTVGQQHPALNPSHTSIVQDSAQKTVHQVSEEGTDPKDF